MDEHQILKKIKESLHAGDLNAEVYLFGSRARGNYTANSDWDLLILVNNPKMANTIEDNFRDKLYDIELETGQIISVFVYTKKYWEKILKFSPLYHDVINDGIRL